MNYRVEIFWGAADTASQKQELRQQLRDALAQLGTLPVWKEVMPGKRLFSNSSYGRILVNGHKVYRITNNLHAANENLAEAIRSFKKHRRVRSFRWTVPSFVPAILIAFFPKCPICWATYASLLSFVGIYIPYYQWMIWVFGGLALINLFLTFKRSQRTGFYLPLLLQITAYVAIVFNRMYWDNKAVIALSVILMVSSSVLLNLKKEFFYNFHKPVLRIR